MCASKLLIPVVHVATGLRSFNKAMPGEQNRVLTEHIKEAFFMKKPCVTIRDETEWVETVEIGWNNMVGTNKEMIKDTILFFQSKGE